MRCVPWQILSFCAAAPAFLSPASGTWYSLLPFHLSLHSCHFIHFTSSLQIQVIEDDRNNRGSEPFVTGVRGQVPPLVTTNFLVKDQGEKGSNSSLRDFFSSIISLGMGLLSVFGQRPVPHWSLGGKSHHHLEHLLG